MSIELISCYTYSVIHFHHCPRYRSLWERRKQNGSVTVSLNKIFPSFLHYNETDEDPCLI